MGVSCGASCGSMSYQDCYEWDGSGLEFSWYDDQENIQKCHALILILIIIIVITGVRLSVCL